MPLPRPPVAISRPTCSRSAVAPVEDGDQLAAVEHADPVRELEDLVELGGDQQDGGAGVALGDGLAMDELDAADVQAARRLVEDQQLQLAPELARDDDLLLVAAGEGAGGAVGRRRPDVELGDLLRRRARGSRRRPGRGRARRARRSSR